MHTQNKTKRPMTKHLYDLSGIKNTWSFTAFEPHILRMLDGADGTFSFRCVACQSGNIVIGPTDWPGERSALISLCGRCVATLKKGGDDAAQLNSTIKAKMKRASKKKAFLFH